MNTTVYVIRHGETDWNVSGRWQGHTDVPLNTIGQKQAELLAQYLLKEQVHFDAIYSSDLIRAYQTAWHIGTALKIPVQLLPSLREINLGVWSGLTRDEIKGRYPTEFALLEQGQDIARGGGETLAILQKRVVTTVEAILSKHPDETLALITHGGPVRMLLAHAHSPNGVVTGPRFHIGNTSITILSYNGSAWQIRVQNDMSHLADQSQAPDLMSAPPDDAEPPQEWNP